MHLKASTRSPFGPTTSWPLSPMSATWIRAHELGQPLMWTVIGESMASSRDSSSSTTRPPGPWSPRSRACRTRCPCRPSPSAAVRSRRQAQRLGPATSASTWSAGTSSTRIFCSGVVRSRPAHGSRPGRPGRSAVAADHPAAAATDEERPSFCACTPTWSQGCSGIAGAGPSSSGRCRYSVSSTSRNLSAPQSATRNLIRAGSAAVGSHSRGTGRPRRPRPQRPPPAPRRRAGRPASGWWTVRRPPTGRSRAVVRVPLRRRCR